MYKLVSIVEGKYYSYLYGCEFTKEYEIGVTSTPSAGCGPMCTFGTLAEVLEYFCSEGASCPDRYGILEVEGTTSEYTGVYGGWRKKGMSSPCPDNTIYLDSLTPIRVLGTIG